MVDMAGVQMVVTEGGGGKVKVKGFTERSEKQKGKRTVWFRRGGRWWWSRMTKVPVCADIYIYSSIHI